jgi:hypothetical protein
MSFLITMIGLGQDSSEPSRQIRLMLEVQQRVGPFVVNFVKIPETAKKTPGQ